ncbi:hypothetical protein SAMN05444394_1338 [Algoriphagus halophilus]|uniref:Uncharacterized protein n=1 Tax=Algoriphagus halophilus TaxID=226505 RepID=A0A1N6DSP6_9BACT|nr:hypothetical protein SAMN05444394_1338 [Algoriphagus halophilus]
MHNAKLYSMPKLKTIFNLQNPLTIKYYYQTT